VNQALLQRAARPVWAEIDLDAITHNIDVIRERVKRPVRFIVPIKANAYGHGAVAVSRHLETIGIDAVATANIEEAIEVRASGVTIPIVMYASHLPEATEQLVAHGLTPTIADVDGLRAAAAVGSAHRPVRAHVEVDAGFGRLGVRFDDAAEFIARVVAEPCVQLEGIYTHVPFGDTSGATWASRSVSAFNALVREVEARHQIHVDFAQVSASAALLHELPDALNTLAPGHLTYGISPLTDVRVGDLGFLPALRALRAQVIHVGQREPGDVLAAKPATRSQQTAVLLLGVDNGYEFAAGDHVLLRGRRCPVLSVTAEYTVVDVSNLPDVAVGDVATIIGDDGEHSIALTDVASARGRSPGYWMMGVRRVPLTYGR
jgi:alanine racemase